MPSYKSIYWTMRRTHCNNNARIIAQIEGRRHNVAVYVNAKIRTRAIVAEAALITLLHLLTRYPIEYHYSDKVDKMPSNSLKVGRALL